MVLKRKTLDSFYTKDSAANLLDLGQIDLAFPSSNSEIDKVASWLAAQEDEQEDEGPE